MFEKICWMPTYKTCQFNKQDQQKKKNIYCTYIVFYYFKIFQPENDRFLKQLKLIKFMFP